MTGRVSETPATIAEALHLRAGSARGIAFLSEEGETQRWTYGDLAEVAQRAAGALHDLGVAPGDRVGLVGSTMPELVAAIFGCWTMGAIAVPLAVPLRLTALDALVEEIRSRADKAGISVLCVDPRVRGLVPLDGVAPRVVDLTDLRTNGRDIELTAPSPDDAALIQFTSGSTAKPKGVVLTHRTLISNGLAAAEHMSLSASDVAVSWLPLYHDFGLIGLTLWPVLLDMATHLIPPETFIASPKIWVQAMSRYRATITAAPNFAYGLAARAIRTLVGNGEDLDLGPLRIAANGAEPVDNDTMDAFAAAAAPVGFRSEAILGVYGLAEGTLGVSSPRPLRRPPPWWVDAIRLAEDGVTQEADPASGIARPLVSVGHAIPGVEVQIRTPHGDRLTDGLVGEIWVQSDHAMREYWEDPEETAHALTDDGWIRTGDLGVLGPHGLYVTGRVKDMIIVGGRNLYPEDAERAANSVPGVRKGNAVAFGILRQKAAEGSRRAREGLVVIAETRLSGDDAAKLAKQIATEVRKVLRIAADHVVLLVPGSLPKTPSGKLQRRLTRKLYEAGQLVQNAVATAGRALGAGGAPEPAV